MILIIDDDPDIRAILAAVLTEAGMACALAGSGAEGVAQAAAAVPEVIILDVMMPGMSGFDTFAALRALPGLGDVPILFLSSANDDARIVRSYRLGAEGYVTKPFNPATLVEKVRSVLTRYRGLRSRRRVGLGVGDVVVGRYRILGILGSGGMGIVYRVKDLQGGEEVALKVLNTLGVADRTQATERFAREVDALSSLEHPNVVRLYEAQMDEDLSFYTMAILPGSSLDLRLKGGPLRVKEALRLAAGVGAGLEVAHDLGILHRDIKPQNILFTEEGAPVLTDFGLVLNLAEGTPRLTRTGLLTGTARYMSPEQIAPRAALDERSDVYSLGIVLFEALTGRTPFADDEDFQAMFRTFSEDPPPPSTFAPELPEAVTRAVMGAIRKDPAERYPSARAMREAMETALEALGEV